MLGDQVNIYLEHGYGQYPESIVLQKGESRTITFLVREYDGSMIDLSSCKFQLTVKADPQYAATALIKLDADFDDIYSELGIVYLTLEAADTDLTPGNYFAELEIQDLADNTVVRSKTIPFQVLESVS